MRDRLSRLVTLPAASWISSNLETWIGEPDQNRAWEYLAATRRQFETWDTQHGPEANAARARARHALNVAEGSDWFWWYYSHNRVSSIDSFDHHFRHELATVFREIGQNVPTWLDRPVHSQAAVQWREMVGAINPRPLEARPEAGPAWSSAAYLDLDQSTGAMQIGSRPLRRLYAGYDASNIYVRLELGPEVSSEDVAVIVREPAGARTWRMRFGRCPECVVDAMARSASGGWSPADVVAQASSGKRAVELAVCLASLGLTVGASVEVSAAVVGREELDGLPSGDNVIRFRLGELLADVPEPARAEGVPHA
jgi:hypothetical protein